MCRIGRRGASSDNTPEAANEQLCADWAECAGTEKLTSLAPLQRNKRHRDFCFLPPEHKYTFPNASMVTSAKRNCNVFTVRLSVLLCMQNDLAEAVISHRWVTGSILGIMMQSTSSDIRRKAMVELTVTSQTHRVNVFRQLIKTVHGVI